MFPPLHNVRTGSLFHFLNPTYIAALTLTVIQAATGVLYRFAQHDGGYAFSPSASIAISEFLKLGLSTCFFYQECSSRHFESLQRCSESERGPSRSFAKERSLLSERPPMKDLEQSDSNTSSIMSQTKMKFGDFIVYCLTEVAMDTKFGFPKLALLYALINNTVFVLYELADPGTIQLVRSGITLATGLVLWFALGSKISNLQWIALMLQTCGLVVTRYSPTTGSGYPFTTYLVLTFQTFLSAVAGVYHQKLCKSEGASLHADNMILFAAGFCCNILIHIIARFIKPSEPGFFTGYNDWGAIMVMTSNVFIGLAITVVYQYADAVIKRFATVISTAFLLYTSLILFGMSMTAMVIPGTMVAFLATWLGVEGSAGRKTKSATPFFPRLRLGAMSRIRDSISSRILRKVQIRLSLKC
ncbi:hypothetical protein FKW77_003564 [Venturia effusa]|uniref:UDP-galactose transporter n=1 Tax=Venturia effusa TaxID=50376 RepID=A0A517LC71_9PEZI|nr:hypothetical protein FKW77_003564 [Venturia effusa]